MRQGRQNYYSHTGHTYMMLLNRRLHQSWGEVLLPKRRFRGAYKYNYYTFRCSQTLWLNWSAIFISEINVLKYRHRFFNRLKRAPSVGGGESKANLFQWQKFIDLLSYVFICRPPPTKKVCSFNCHPLDQYLHRRFIQFEWLPLPWSASVVTI